MNSVKSEFLRIEFLSLFIIKKMIVELKCIHLNDKIEFIHKKNSIPNTMTTFPYFVKHQSFARCFPHHYYEQYRASPYERSSTYMIVVQTGTDMNSYLFLIIFSYVCIYILNFNTMGCVNMFHYAIIII